MAISALKIVRRMAVVYHATINISAMIQLYQSPAQFYFSQPYSTMLSMERTLNSSWRSVKVPRHVTIIFPHRSERHRRVDVDQTTLGEAWDKLKDAWYGTS
ncbi:hypothetical protein DOTSEDRAFT_72885 [Dothistroma septosporum NZE10]|uniref:Uncharacterized protein n=1 Tax=Dothistroma septosporum (strain NZE10 / CBS 128990) TaxID=675120 RepID=M2XMJ5_DOTSN|nr:hypothetical protein DOTSEDRAFT_72885 [Dothistroma septosporum NZE10]